MEFLIIVFIIVSVVSSLSRNIKKHMKKESPFDPWSFDSDSMRGDHKNVKEMIKAERDSVEKEKPEVEQIDKKEDLQKAYAGTQMVEEYGFQPHEETREEIKTLSLLDRKTEDTAAKDTGELGRELKVLLTGEKLPLGIVASEVLGPPRALKPYSHKKA
ncbi:MAG: hypothetical protein ACOC5R_05295 [Elusimicrobiota bacterium]